MLLIALAIISCVLSCNRDDTDENPIIKPELYKIIGDVDTLEEKICKDSIPTYATPGDEYNLTFKKNIFLVDVYNNASKRSQWVFTKRKITYADKSIVRAIDKVYFYDNETNECQLLDSSDLGINAIGIGGDYIAYSLASQTVIYDINSQVKRTLNGRSVSLSPNGKTFKVYDISEKREIKFYNTFDLELLLTEPYGSGAPSNPIWINDNEFMSFNVVFDAGKPYHLCEKWDLSEKEVDTIFNIENSYGAGIPQIWIEKPNKILLKFGYEFDISDQMTDKFYDNCANKKYTNFFDIGKGKEFIGRKVYYEVNEQTKEVIYSTFFHLLKPYEGVEQRIKFVFDNDEF